MQLRKPASVPVLSMVLLCFMAGSGAWAAHAADDDEGQSQLSFGVQMARRGLWSEALFRFRQAERAKPGDPRILNNIAVAYEALGKFDKALEYYQNAIKADAGNKDLKRNYSRFVEFYRNFKPDVQQGAENANAAEPEAEPAAADGAAPGGGR
ncbi:MAG: tetratricopeptide repeat protein [Thermoanaerobaculia bacterium]|nr:tetratricopeptide repeat protein [Thermoanaerobaculia bacterium]